MASVRRGERFESGNRHVRLIPECGWAVLVFLMGQLPEPINRYGIAKALRGREGIPGFTESSVYREIDRLVASEHLEEGEIATPRGPLRGYVLSLKGIEAVRRWVRTPAGIPVEVCPGAWLRVASIDFSRPEDVRSGLSGLAADLDARMDELELAARIARRTEPWTTGLHLRFSLERAGLDASRRWVGEALALLDPSEGAIAG